MYVFVCLFIWQDITAYPVSDDMMNWKAEIEGLRNSVCEGSCFKINLSYRENKREGGRKEDRGRGKREGRKKETEIETERVRETE